MKPETRVKAGASKAEAAAKRDSFAKAFISNGGNATQAAIAAGYSKHTAKQAGSRMLTHADVSAAIEAHRKSASEAAGLTVERTLREVARIAFYDPRKAYDTKGNLKSVADLDDDTAAAVAGSEVIEAPGGRGKSRQVVGITRRIKFADKNAALEKAMKHLGLYKQDNDQLGKAIARAIIVPAKRTAGDGGC